MAGFEPKTGHKMKLYKNTGTYASPVWLLVAEIGDVTLSEFTRGLAELKRRANNFTKNLPSLFQSITLDFRLHFGLAQTVYEGIRDDHFAGTPREWAIMANDITYDAHGLRCPFLVSQFPWDQALEDVSGHDVQLAIAYMLSGGTEVDPSWYTVPTTTTT
jgi:hypothetical protein